MNRNVIIIAVIVAVAGTAIISATTWNAEDGEQVRPAPDTVVDPTDSKTDEVPKANVIGGIGGSLNDAGLGKFATFAEYAEFLGGFDVLDRYTTASGSIREDRMFPESASRQRSVDAPQSLPIQSDPGTHSTTNVQVKGVDEADFVKNDGRYIYALKHNTLSIVDTQNITESGAFVTDLDIPPLVQKYDMFVNGDRLVVLYNIANYNQAGFIDDYATHALVLDITDRGAIEYVMEYSAVGKLHTGRMIGDHVYTVSSEVPDYEDPIIPVLRLDQEVIQDTPIYYLDDVEQPSLTTVMAFDVNGGSSNSLSIVMDYAGTAFMSRDNLYITSFERDSDSTVSLNLVLKLLEPILELYPEHIRERLVSELSDIDPEDEDAAEAATKVVDDAVGELPDNIRGSAIVGGILEQLEAIDDIADTNEITSIHRIGVDGTDFDLAANGAVPGRLLNQFSMDERGDRLRVATTTGGWDDSFNNVFVLDGELAEVGALVGIAHDEQIYSTRFVEDKLYMVTFREIDPFFVIDLSTDSPRIEGKLKLPGYSDYLHFYDENTVIGIGREEGVKIAVFDISDMKRPTLADSEIIGSWGTYTPVEDDHRAALVDRAKSLLVVPVFEYDESGNSLEFMAYDITQSGLELVHTIPHEAEQDWNRTYARSLYIGDDLYTVSEKAVVQSPLSEPFYTLKVPIGPR